MTHDRRQVSDMAEMLDDATTELLQIYPRLVDALERDSGATGESRVAESRAPAQPVNPAVLEATTTLAAQIPAADAQARRRLDPDRPNTCRDVETCISSAVAIFRRLAAIDPNAARRYAGQVFAWQRIARKAVGLSRPAVPIGHHCPCHDDPATPLLAAGDEGTLNHHRGAREAITWRRGQAIFCPECKAQWGPAEWPLLGRMLTASPATPG